MKKKYKIFWDNKWVEMNVAPENEQAFLEKYKNNSPTIVEPDELIFPKDHRLNVMDFAPGEKQEVIPIWEPEITNYVKADKEFFINNFGKVDWNRSKENQYEDISSMFSKFDNNHDAYLNSESDEVYTASNARDWFDHKIENNLTFSGDVDFDKKIIQDVLVDGTHGYNPHTKRLFRLSKGINIPEEEKNKTLKLFNAPSLPGEITITENDIQKTILWDDATEEQQMDWLKLNDPINYSIKNSSKINKKYAENNWDDISYQAKVKYHRNHNPEGLNDFLKTTPNPNVPSGNYFSDILGNNIINHTFLERDAGEAELNVSSDLYLSGAEIGKNIIETLDYVNDLNPLKAYAGMFLSNFGVEAGDRWQESTRRAWEKTLGIIAEEGKVITDNLVKIHEELTNNTPDKVITYENDSAWIKNRSFIDESLVGRDLTYHGIPESLQPKTSLTNYTNTSFTDLTEFTAVANFVDSMHFDNYDNDATKISDRNLEIYTSLYSGKYGYNPYRDELSLLQNPIEMSLQEQIFSLRNPKSHPKYNEYIQIKQSTPRPPSVSIFKLKEQKGLEKLQELYFGFDFSFEQTGGMRNENGKVVKGGWWGTGFDPGDNQVLVKSLYTGKEIVLDFNMDIDLARKLGLDDMEAYLEAQRQLLEDFIDEERNPEGGRRDPDKFMSFFRRTRLSDDQIDKLYGDYNLALEKIETLKRLWGMEDKEDAYVLDLYSQVFTSSTKLTGSGSSWALSVDKNRPGVVGEPSIIDQFGKTPPEGYDSSKADLSSFKIDLDLQDEKFWELNKKLQNANPNQNPFGIIYDPMQPDNFGLMPNDPYYGIYDYKYRQNNPTFGREGEFLNSRFPKITWEKANELEELLGDFRLKGTEMTGGSDISWEGRDVWFMIEAIEEAKEEFREELATWMYLYEHTDLDDVTINKIMSGQEVEGLENYKWEIQNTKKWDEIYRSNDLIVDPRQEESFVSKKIHFDSEKELLEENIEEGLEFLTSKAWEKAQTQLDIETGYRSALEETSEAINKVYIKAGRLKKEMDLTLQTMGELEKELILYIDKYATEIADICNALGITKLEEFVSDPQAVARMNIIDSKISELLAEKEALSITFLANAKVYQENHDKLIDLMETEEDMMLYANLISKNYEWGYVNTSYAVNGFIDLFQGLVLNSTSAYLNFMLWGFGTGDKESRRHYTDWLTTNIIALDDWIQNTNFDIDAFQHTYANSAKPRMKPGDIGNVSDFFQYALEAVSSQTANLVMTIGMPGYTSLWALGGAAGFNKFGDMHGATYMYNNPEVFKQYKDVYGNHYAQEFGLGETFGNSLWTAAWEGGTEFITLKTQVLPFKKALFGKKGYNLNNEVFNNYFSPKNIAYGTLKIGGITSLEVSGEVANQMAQNFGDLLVGKIGVESVYDNIDVAGLDAAFVSSGMSITTAGIQAVQAFWTPTSTDQKLIQNSIKLQELISKLPTKTIKNYDPEGNEAPVQDLLGVDEDFMSSAPDMNVVMKDGEIVTKPFEGAPVKKDSEGNIIPLNPSSYEINGEKLTRQQMIDRIIKEGGLNVGNTGVDSFTIANDSQLLILNQAALNNSPHVKTLEGILNLVQEQDKLLSILAARVDLLQPEEKEKIIALTKQIFKIRKEILEIKADGSYDFLEKVKKIQALQIELDAKVLEKDNLLNNYTEQEVLKNFTNKLEQLKKIWAQAKEMGAPDINVRLENGKKFKESVIAYETNNAGAGVLDVIEGEVSIDEAYQQNLQEIIDDKNASKEDREWAEKELEASKKDPKLWLNRFGNLLDSDIQKYGVFQPKFSRDKDGKIVKDKKGRPVITGIDIIINTTTAIQDGKLTSTIFHEIVHAMFWNSIKANPKIRQEMGDAIAKVLLKGNIKFKNDTYERIFWKKIKSYDPEGFAKGDYNGEEMLATLSEMMSEGTVIYNNSWGSKLGNIFNIFSRNYLGFEGEFNSAKDFENFLISFHENIEKNEVNPAISRIIAKGANGKIFKDKTTFTERDGAQEFSNIVDIHSRSNPDLKNEFDDLVQNTDGTLKHKDDAEFKLSAEYIEGYEKIVDSKLLDGLIQVGMTELGLPPEALKDFVRKVKERIGEKYLREFNLDKNNSLFGWLTGISSIVYYAKGDIINEYKKAGTNLQTSIDKVIGESGTTIGDTIEDTGKDQALEDLENADLSPEAQNEIQEQIDDTYDGDLVEDLLPDMAPTVELIDEKTDEADVDIEGIKYKDLKNLLISSQDIKLQQFSQKAVVPTGPLFGILNDVSSGLFGVDPLRLIAKQDLNKEQRMSAQTYIYDFVVTEDGTLNPDFIKLLPEGTDVDGNSTGIANTVLKDFYIKGDRVTMAKTGSAAGNINWIKRDDITLEEVLDKFGINLDGSFRTNTKADGAIREFIIQVTMLTANQALKKKAIRDGIAEAIIRKSLDVGKSEQMFSNRIPAEEQGAYIETFLTKFNSIKNVKGARKILTEYFGKYKSFDREVTETYLNRNGIYKERNIYSWDNKMLQKFGQVFRTGKRIVGDKFANIVFQSMINGVSRTTIGTVGVWQKLFPNAEKGAAFKKKKYGEKKLSNGIKFDNNKITINLFGEDLSVTEFRKMEIEQLELMADFLDFLKAGGKETAFLYEAVMSDAVHTMGSIIRNSALLSALPINDKGELDYTNGTIQEHMVPQNIITKLHLSIPESIDFRKIVKKVYGQMPLLKVHDDMVTDAGFKSSMPDVFYDVIIPRILKGELDWLPDGLGGIIRYTKSGVDLNIYIDPNTGKSITEVFGLGFESFPNLKNKNRDIVVGLQNFYIDQILTGEMTRAKAKSEFGKAVKLAEATNQSFSNVDIDINIQQAFSQKIDNAINNTDKGISVYDADDTILRSKSGVIVRKTNDDGTPKPKRKVIFLAGSAGSGKSNVIKQLGLEDQGFKIVNQDISLEWLVKNSGLPTDMREFTPEQSSKWGSLQWEAREIAQRKAIKFRGNGDGVVVDGTGASTVSLFTQMQKFKDAGYDVQMIFVDSSLETALSRNKARPERSLKDFIVERNWKAVQKNKKAFEEEFGDNFAYINTDNINIGDALPVEFTGQLEDFVSGYEITRLTSEEFANQGTELQEAGAEFDFSEFNKVIDGEPGPYLESLRNRIKKFGNKDVFILTARPQQSAFAIQQFLKGEGIDIPIENITGLANSDGNAKAEWMLEKYIEGYNNFFFVDDAWGNVDAVKKVLEQLDVKSDVVQAFSNKINNLDVEFNKIIERKKGVKAEKKFSMAEARKRGAEPDILRSIKRLFIPPSAEDFKGLLYAFLGKGEQGNADMEFFNENLLQPFGKAIMAWNTFKHNMISDYKALKKNFPNIKLNKKVPGTSFTNDTAIRVYLWDKAGFDIPGISKKLKKQLIKHVNSNGDLKGFAEGLSVVSKRKEGYIEPSDNWMVETIMSDLSNITDRVSRKEFLQEWIANKDIIFSEKNLNKIEAVYGNSFRYALDNILYRMENGTNRMVGDDKVVNWFTNWINNSVGAIMFFNMRSSLLQTMSTVNFINWSDNNLFEASKAFANQKQFWKDFVTLFNSPMLKQRRRGIQIDVSASELTKSFSEGKATPGGVLNYLLKLGFTPTQAADSFAIAFGGASFFRNRYNKYIKEGKSPKEAEEQAMLDFQEIAEETQQSSRADLVSQQQASVLGRIVLAFQNVTMQYTRLTKKALSDLVNGRGDFKTNVSKIVYYGMVQNILFAALQTALLFFLFSGEEDENMEDKVFTVFNNSLDSFMRGTGVYGAMGSTIKNTYFEWQRQEDLPAWKQDDWKIAEQAINLSPPIGSKVRKIISAWKTKQYNEDLSDELGFRIENPNLAMSASLIEALFNVPTRRLLDKANNLEEAITGNHETWKRVMLAMGWNMWSLGIKDEEVVSAKQENEKQKKEEKQKEKEEKERKEKEEKEAKGIKTVQCSGVNSEGVRCGNTIETDKKTWKCVHHAEFKEGSDTDGDGKKEYRCTAIKSDGNRCKNKTENESKRCYAHPKAEILE